MSKPILEINGFTNKVDILTSIQEDLYNGNKDKNLEEKIEEDECLSNIIPIHHICPNFPQ